MSVRVKAQAFTLQALVVVALVFVLVLFLIWSSTSNPRVLTVIKCKTFTGIYSLPFVKGKITIPSACLEIEEQSNVHVVNLTEETLFFYAYNCFERGELGKSEKTFVCFEIYSENYILFNESDFTDYLISKGYCNKLPNNLIESSRRHVNCGNANKIIWVVSDTSCKNCLIIKYDSIFKAVKIIAPKKEIL